MPAHQRTPSGRYITGTLKQCTGMWRILYQIETLLVLGPTDILILPKACEKNAYEKVVIG